MSMAERFRAARKSIGMTQLELSKSIGFDPSTISRVELGKHQPSIRLVRAYAHTCRVEAAFFLAESEPEAPGTAAP